MIKNRPDLGRFFSLLLDLILSILPQLFALHHPVVGDAGLFSAI